MCTRLPYTPVASTRDPAESRATPSRAHDGRKPEKSTRDLETYSSRITDPLCSEAEKAVLHAEQRLDGSIWFVWKACCSGRRSELLVPLSHCRC